MTEPIEQNVLKRKAEAGRPRLSIAAMSPAKAMKIGLAKAAQDTMRLALTVEGLTEQRQSLAELLDSLQDRALFAVLNGPAEALGLMALSPPMLAALVEMQTTGRVSPNEAPSRRPTRTDATMAVEFIDRILAELENALSGDQDLIWAGGFRYGSFLSDPRPLGLLLDDTVYRVFRLTVDLAAGAKRGELLLALPASGRGIAPETRPAEVADPGLDWSDQLERTVLASPVLLDAVLHRMTVPLATVLGLKAGDTLALPLASVGSLFMETTGLRRLAAGRLGQARGHRAVRLSLEEGEQARTHMIAADAGPIANGAK